MSRCSTHTKPDEAMKTVFLLSFFLGWSQCLLAQKDKLWRSDVRQELANYDQVITFHDKKKRFATVKIIDKAGVLRNEANFKDEMKHGYEQFFYPDGGLYWKSDYRDNVQNGIFMVYYPDGSLKRKEKYRNGFRKEGYCYDSLGNTTAYYPFKTQPEFKDGLYSLQRYFRDKWPSSLRGNLAGWTFLEMNLIIGTDSLARVGSLKAEDFEHRKALASAVKTMPKWTPGTFDGQVSETNYRVSLVLTPEGLYLTELMNSRRGIAPPNSPNGSNRHYSPR
ncbi:toxin-antitoxin system YwqK family antitoxin [Runella sp.]|uniref:toxin-antitoxin system YwqK family antitoxin n=1 Tax=Runella sp. TaxID=1960881 RepID=UPI00260D3B50|nr:hypothetical protein [Runella sp.]